MELLLPGSKIGNRGREVVIGQLLRCCRRGCQCCCETAAMEVKIRCACASAQSRLCFWLTTDPAAPRSLAACIPCTAASRRRATLVMVVAPTLGPLPGVRVVWTTPRLGLALWMRVSVLSCWGRTSVRHCVDYGTYPTRVDGKSPRSGFLGPIDLPLIPCSFRIGAHVLVEMTTSSSRTRPALSVEHAA